MDYAVRSGKMLKSVHLLGTSLKLDEGQRVLLIPALNQLDKSRFFAAPIGGEWMDDSILLDHGDWELED